VFSADRLDAQRMEFRYPVRFAIFKAEFETNDPACPFVWARNGKVIIRGRGIQKAGHFRVEAEYSAVERALATKRSKSAG
jgi:hypothetical protein